MAGTALGLRPRDQSKKINLGGKRKTTDLREFITNSAMHVRHQQPMGRSRCGGRLERLRQKLTCGHLGPYTVLQRDVAVLPHLRQLNKFLESAEADLMYIDGNQSCFAAREGET
eukprot:6456036-Amphidinium_carterae.2